MPGRVSALYTLVGVPILCTPVDVSFPTGNVCRQQSLLPCRLLVSAFVTWAERSTFDNGQGPRIFKKDSQEPEQVFRQ